MQTLQLVIDFKSLPIFRLESSKEYSAIVTIKIFHSVNLKSPNQLHAPSWWRQNLHFKSYYWKELKSGRLLLLPKKKNPVRTHKQESPSRKKWLIYKARKAYRSKLQWLVRLRLKFNIKNLSHDWSKLAIWLLLKL